MPGEPGSLDQWFLIRSSFPIWRRQHLWLSQLEGWAVTDIWLVDARDVAENSVMHRIVPPHPLNKELSAPKYW